MEQISYQEAAVQRFTEFGGFAPVAEEALSSLAAEWAGAVLERRESGLVTRIAFLPIEAGSLLTAIRDDLAAHLSGGVQGGRMEALGVMMLISRERISRALYDQMQALVHHSGRVRVVPVIVDLGRGAVFGHEGPPFGVDPDLYTLAEPFPEQPAEAMRPWAERKRRSGPMPWVTVGLASVLVAIWVIMSLSGRSWTATQETDLLIRWGGAIRPGLILTREYWRLFTAGFLHIGAGHLVTNALSLWWIGQIVERLYGPVRLFAVYLFALVAGSTASLVFGPPVTLSAGASGAVSGLLGALIWYRWRAPEQERLSQFPVLLVAVITLFGGLFFYENIDTWNHVGGLVGGFLAAAAAGFPQAGQRSFTATLAHLVAVLALVGLAGAVSVGLFALPGPSQRMASAMNAWEAERYPEAQKGLEGLAAEYPEDSRVLYYLAWFYYSQGMYEKARAAAERVLAIDPAFEPGRELLRALPPAAR